MPDSTRTRLVKVALHLFAEKGYAGTSVADVLKTAGVHSGSLYHFFPTKQDLLLAVLERYLEGISPMLLEPAWSGVRDPIERVFRLLGAYRSFLAETDCLYGCPIGSLALEFREPDPPVRKKLAANFTAWTRAVERCLLEAGSRLPSDVNPETLARFVLTTMEGAVMQARTYRDLAVFDASVGCLRDYFDRLLAAAAPSKETTARPRRRPAPRRTSR